MPERSHIPSFRHFAEQAEAVIYDAAVEGLGRFAEQQRRNFVTRIRAQRFRSFQIVLYRSSNGRGGTNLSPRWIARKAALHLDPRTMIATGTYAGAIRVFPRHQPNRRGSEFRIGFHHRALARNARGRPVPLTLNELARIQEYGSITRNIPARPHWRPFMNIIRRAGPGGAHEITEHIGRRLRITMRGFVQSKHNR